MIDLLKTCIKNKEADKILTLITDHPQVLDDKDENGVSGILILAYNGIKEAFDKAKQIKKSFTFHEAVACGKMDLVRAFINQDKGYVNQYSSDGFTPLSLAAFFDQTEIAKFLLNNGADPNLHATNPFKVNALHSAVAKGNYDLCKLMIEHGVNLNATQTQDVTPLHSAVHRGDLNIVKLLVENGAEINLQMENGDTALSIAEKENHKEIKGYLDQALSKS